MSHDHAEIRDRFHLELGRLQVHAHSMSDFNIGIALGWLGPHNGEDVSNWLNGRVSLPKRREVLKPLILKMGRFAGNEALAQIETWFEKACEPKAIRYDYAHACWGLPDKAESDNPVLRMLPMNWNFAPGNRDESALVTPSALAEQRARIGKFSGQFLELQEKYAKYASRANSIAK